MGFIGFIAALPVIFGLNFVCFWLIAWVLDKKRIGRKIWLGITIQILLGVAVRLVMFSAYGAKVATEKFPLEFGLIGALFYLLSPLAIGTIGVWFAQSITTNRCFQASTGTLSGIIAFGLAAIHQIDISESLRGIDGVGDFGG